MASFLDMTNNSISVHSNPIPVNGQNPNHRCTQFTSITPSDQVNVSPSGLCTAPLEGDGLEGRDFYDGIFTYLNQMLMEEDDLQNKPCMFIDCLALQAAEKSFYDVLVDNPLSPKQDCPFANKFTDNRFDNNGESHSPNGSRGKRNNIDHEDESADVREEPSNKHLASSSESSENTDMYDSALLCKLMNRQWLKAHGSILGSCPETKTSNLQQKRRNRGKKKNFDKLEEVVDLRKLIIQHAEAVASNNISSSAADELLKKIRKHSSPYGNSTERMAHYFCNAIEARLAGMGTLLYRSFSSTRISAAQILKSYKAYITACPFHKMSNILANKSIALLSRGRKKIHIIDFGILYGFQWPCIIQGLSLRPGGAPKLRITGIDFPQPGFRPIEHIEETGRRLADYARRFNVPFQYNAIAKNWEDVKIEDLNIDKDDMLVVNSIYRLKNVRDETVVESSPREVVLNLIKKLNPKVFVQGVVNGTYNVPFFVTRVREALSYFSTLFDMFEATIEEREDKDRFLFEQEVFGRDVMNVVACEGRSRVERPETYKQWQVRNVRAGFRQIPLIRELVEEVRAKVKLNYHKDFVVDEDSNWMLQGWKGRVLYALSLWTPVDQSSNE